MKGCILFLTVAGLATIGCGTSAPTRPAANAQPPKTAITKDESNLFPSAGRVATQVYPDLMMNKQFLPGGTMAEFTAANGAGEYREFLVHLADGRNASFMLQDYKKVLQNPTYEADKAACFGTDDGQPTYVFARGPYLAGIVGLPKDRAEAAAKELADRLS